MQNEILIKFIFSLAKCQC